jgi:hypothetical protein|uniref:Uncharacterized protein n=1 Tax=Desulfobacca acetoxidans TaxID=60893 RepID=A0A7C3UYH5_9BACT
MRSEKCLGRHSLPNGLTVEFWDLSRHTAGDRWQVVVEARVPIPLTPENIPPELQDRRSEVASALGSPVMFIKQEVRNFIAEGEVPALVQKIATELFASIRGYLGHPEFAVRFIRKQFKEYQERQAWQQYLKENGTD